MKLRVLIAGILGGIVLFNWGFVAHMVLPIGMMGIITAPNEPVLRNHLREHLPEPGVYMIPGMPAKPTPEQTKKHDEDYKTGPNGLLFVDPSGGDPSLPPHLIKEVVANILSALLAAALLACVNVKYFAGCLRHGPRRLCLAGSVGAVLELVFLLTRIYDCEGGRAYRRLAACRPRDRGDR